VASANHGISVEQWNVIISLSSLVVLLVGIIVAVKNLKIIARSQRLDVINSFIKELKAHEESRKFLFKEYKFVSIEYMEEKSIVEIEKVINSLNRISLLLDNKLIEPQVIFGLCHTMIIRCEYQLREYIKAKEKIVGGRYGRRISKLATRAKKFHDSYEYHRCNPIYIYGSNHSSKEIYRTTIGTTFEEELNNQLEWFWRRLWKNF
jgi:hypothetical protein